MWRPPRGLFSPSPVPSVMKEHSHVCDLGACATFKSLKFESLWSETMMRWEENRRKGFFKRSFYFYAASKYCFISGAVDTDVINVILKNLFLYHLKTVLGGSSTHTFVCLWIRMCIWRVLPRTQPSQNAITSTFPATKWDSLQPSCFQVASLKFSWCHGVTTGQTHQERERAGTLEVRVQTNLLNSEEGC